MKLVAQQPITTMLCWHSIFSPALKINRTGESFFPPLTYQWPSDSKHNSQEKSCCRCFNATTDHSSLLSTRSAPRTLKPSLIFMLQSVNMCRVYYEWPDWVFIHCVQAPILYIHSRAQMTASNILTFFKMKYKVCVKCSKIFPAYSPHEEAGTCCESRDLIVVIGMRANRVSARAAEKVHD